MSPSRAGCVRFRFSLSPSADTVVASRGFLALGSWTLRSVRPGLG